MYINNYKYIYIYNYRILYICVCVLIRRCVIVFGSFPTWISDPHRLVHHRDTTYWGYCIKDTSNFFSTWFIVIYIQDLVPPPLKKRHSGARHHQGWRLLLQEARIYALGTGGSERSIPTSSDSPATATKMRQDFRHFNDPVEVAYVSYVQFHHVSSCFFRMSWVRSWDLNSTIYRYRSSLNNNYPLVI